MLGNTFGRIFRITACGESYGKGLAVIVDGVPAGLSLTEEYIQISVNPDKVNWIHQEKKLMLFKYSQECSKVRQLAHL